MFIQKSLILLKLIYIVDIQIQKLINYVNLGLRNLYQHSSLELIKKKSAIDFKYAYVHATMDDETFKLTGFWIRDERFAFIT